MILLEEKETPIFKLDGYNPLIKTADLDTRINTTNIMPRTGGNMKRGKFNIFDKAGDFLDKIIEKKNALTDIDIKLPKFKVEHEIKKGSGLWSQLKVPLIVLAVGIVVKRMMENNDRKRRKRKY